MRAVGSQIFSHNLKCEGVSSGSNLGRWSTNGWPGAPLIPWLGSAKVERCRRHGRRLEGAQACPIGHQTPIWFFLRDLGYERNLFYPLIAVELGHKRQSTRRRPGRRWGLPPAKLWLQEVVQRLPRGLLLLLGLFNGSNRWWIAQIWWRLGFGGFRVLRVKIWRTRATIYRGFLDRIVDGINPNTFLVWIELYLMKIQTKSRRGRIQVGYDNGNHIFCWVSTG
jgi:hypothetical protein